MEIYLALAVIYWVLSIAIEQFFLKLEEVFGRGKRSLNAIVRSDDMSEGLNYQFLWDTFFVALSGVPITLFVTLVALLDCLPTWFLTCLNKN